MMNIPYVKITEEMRLQAQIESKRRDPYINHHFDVLYLSNNQRDILGFLGEFACCELLGINWRKNIRENYQSIDDFDFVYKGNRVDVKTETVPVKYAKKILRKKIGDNELYGRRLINSGQYDLLQKYDIVIFSLFARDHYKYWFPIGYLETKTIIKSYPPTTIRPDGNGKYPFSACPIPTSILKPISDL